MAHEIAPKESGREKAFALWMQAPNPMVTLFKTFDITNLVRVSKREGLKLNMLLAYCVGKAAVPIREFYVLPVGDKLFRYDSLAVNTIIRNKSGELSSCDIAAADDRESFNREYLRYTRQAAESCTDRDLSSDCMVIGTSAILETELDGAVGMYSGLYNNPFLIWGRYRKKMLRCYLPVSFQFHHTQMDGAHAGRFLENLQREIQRVK